MTYWLRVSCEGVLLLEECSSGSKGCWVFRIRIEWGLRQPLVEVRHGEGIECKASVTGSAIGADLGAQLATYE